MYMGIFPKIPISASASRAVDHWFAPCPGHTEDYHRNGPKLNDNILSNHLCSKMSKSPCKMKKKQKKKNNMLVNITLASGL